MRDALPAILFNYDRSLCEKICQALLSQLTKAETLFKDDSAAWKARLSGWEKWKSEQEKMGSRNRQPKPKTKKGRSTEDVVLSKAESTQEAANMESDIYASFDPEAPVEGFHFAGHAEASDLSPHFQELKRREIRPWLIDGLKRGIGIHHAGMNRKYRQV